MSELHQVYSRINHGQIRYGSPFVITILFSTVLAANSCDCAAAARQQSCGQSPMRRIGVEMHQSSKIPNIIHNVFEVQTGLNDFKAFVTTSRTSKYSSALTRESPEVSEITFCITVCMYACTMYSSLSRTLEAKKQ